VTSAVQRTPVAFYHIVTDKGVDLGWVGYCEAFDEAMLPVEFHEGGEDGAMNRARADPPKPLSTHQGRTYAPYSWLIKALRDPSYLPAAKAMDLAARRAHRATAEKPSSFLDRMGERGTKMTRRVKSFKKT